MPEKVFFSKDLGVIQVDSYGDVTAQDLITSLAEVKRLSEEHGVNKVFVDASRETSIPVGMPIHDFGTKVSEDVRNLKYAAVVAPEMKEELHFLETVTRNRGMDVRMFDSAKEAIAWLQG